MTHQELLSEIPLTEEDKLFISEHLDQNTDQLAFSLPRTPKSKFLLQQIQARKKIKTKLPAWYANPDFILPQSLSLEQSSSESTARFKQQLIGGAHLIDMTGGLGIDTYYLSEGFEQTTYFEQQKELVILAKHNFKVAGIKQVTCIHADATEYLKKNELTADWIYIDPARRNEAQRKVYHLSDCTPDIQQHLPLLLTIAPEILIKTSPVLDIDLTIKTLPGICAVYVLGFDQECKEVLYHIKKNHEKQHTEIPIHSIILDKNGQATHELRFTRNEESQQIQNLSNPLIYLYEPHPALLKAGALKSLTNQYPVQKLSVNSHLYTSEEVVTDFPGRIFTILAQVKPDAKWLQPYLDKSGKANLTIRNFPANVSDLRNKLRLKEGGNKYLFATTLADHQKVILITEKFYNYK